MPSSEAPRRSKLLKGALELELLSIGWIMTEAILSAVAAFRADSLSLSAFSVDSAIELVSGMVLAVRLFLEIQSGSEGEAGVKLERYASGLVGICLFVLGAYISLKSGQSLRLQMGPSLSVLGLVTAAASSLFTPWLAFQKLRYGRILNSPSLVADAMCSFTCAYMSWTLLAGLGLNALFHWWWIDALAAVGILYFVLTEAWECWHAFSSGGPHVHGHHHHH